ncbi:MAG TPA: hypothetical protein VF933_06640 [Streptosporangiaceae bacterium]
MADAGYGQSITFRLELNGRGWRYVIAVKGTRLAAALTGTRQVLLALIFHGG